MRRHHPSRKKAFGVIALAAVQVCSSYATPANKAALKGHYEQFLPEELNRCSTCHLPSKLTDPQNLDEFPHNPFGKRLRELGEELATAHKPKNISVRLEKVADEDSDSDGVPNQTELLLGHNPGDSKDTPDADSLKTATEKQARLAAFLSSYRWKPFETVRQPEPPSVKRRQWARNDIDLFIAAEHEKRGLHPRPEASREILVRRVYLDLVGINPTPEERRAFLADTSPDAYESLVNRLLQDPRYGERWGRHWMDIWRYSDWAGWSGGNQIRDSQPHIWRWRDWIIESLNQDKPYDRMLVEMLAADEVAPEDPKTLRATGFLARNYKMLSREQWLEDTVKHTSQAFLGLTIGCAKCHNHRTDPISQDEYYELRAVFEPHQVRTDRVPGELNTAKDGLVRTYDVETNTPTYFFVRGDERKADTNRIMKPGVPKALCWRGCDSTLDAHPISLPEAASNPDRRSFVIHDTVSLSEAAVRKAKEQLAQLEGKPENARKEAQLAFAIAESKHDTLLTLLRIEDLEGSGKRDSDPELKSLADVAGTLQKRSTLLEAKLKWVQAQAAKHAASPEDKKALDSAKTKLAEAEKELATAQGAFETAGDGHYTPRQVNTYPGKSTGRRLAFARWVTDRRNPLTARVAMNHIWLRHFGRGIVTTPENLGANGNAPSNAQLLDWLAAEFMRQDWSMKAMHRMILTSSTYRMVSTDDSADSSNSRIDPDNIYLWRMPSRRMEAELVRDNLLASAGDLEPVMGGPEVDQNLGLTSRRRSVYLRLAAEKEVEFLKIFDGPAVTECYQRHPTVMPQQALALANSKLAIAEARSLTAKIESNEGSSSGSDFVKAAFERVLAREPGVAEQTECEKFLANASDKRKARENLVLVLFNHNDFVTVR